MFDKLFTSSELKRAFRVLLMFDKLFKLSELKRAFKHVNHFNYKMYIKKIYLFVIWLNLSKCFCIVLRLNESFYLVDILSGLASSLLAMPLTLEQLLSEMPCTSPCRCPLVGIFSLLLEHPSITHVTELTFHL